MEFTGETDSLPEEDGFELAVFLANTLFRLSGAEVLRRTQVV
jgi:hypothetical protein